jgi:hypothetical protein
MATVSEVRSAADWRGSDFADGEFGGEVGSGTDDRQDSKAARWLGLGGGQRAELRAALAAFEATGPPLTELNRADFPLPTLETAFRELGDDLATGRCFALIRGVPVDGLTERQGEILALGIGSYFGAVVPQGPSDDDGTRQAAARHVRDIGVDPAASTAKSYQHNRGLSYHADPTDIVGLLCIRPARSGGLSSIISAVAVHNEIVRTRPDLAGLLYEPWWHDHRNGDGPDSFSQRPLFTVDEDGRLSAAFGLDYLRSAQRGAGVPPFTVEQAAMVELLDELTNDPRFALTMDLRAGDLQLLNNHVIMHSRTEYVDHPEPVRRRDLIRIWIAVPDGDHR